MSITSKQRAKLRSLAQSLDAIAQFGKGELTDEQLAMVEQMLTARELIKCRVLESSAYTPAELCTLLSEKTGSVPVQTIGGCFVLYRRNPKNPVISLR
ncbi:MAG: YhbY family RNA-binding protein [Oscillospiraceae bacterium]